MVNNMAFSKGPTGMRRERIQKMHQMLIGAGEVNLPRFLASCAYSMGLSTRKAREHLSILLELGLVEVDEAAGTITEIVSED